MDRLDSPCHETIGDLGSRQFDGSCRSEARWLAVDGGDDVARVRVLWVVKGLGPGGAEQLLLSFARFADHARFAIGTAYLLPHKDHLVERLQSAATDVVCLDAEHFWSPGWLLRLRRLVRDGQIDVVHFHSPLVAAVARPVLATVRPRPALMSTAHNVWSSFHPLTRLIDRASAALEDHVLAVSEQVYRGLPRTMRRRGEVLVHGVDVDEIERRRKEREDARARLGVTGRHVVITIANLRVDKDYPNLFDVAERVLADRDDLVFLAVGQGHLEDELEADLARRGLGDRFRMLGYQEDPVGCLVAADVFTLASRHEGLPISLLEALAAGLPSAVTAVGGVPDVITDGVEGRLVQPQDPAALAAAISELLEPATNARMSAAASERARDFGIARAVERQQAVYEQLAARRR